MTTWYTLIGKMICVRQQHILYEGVLKAITQNEIIMHVTATKQMGVGEDGREYHWVYNRKKKREYRSLVGMELVSVEVQLELGEVGSDS